MSGAGVFDFTRSLAHVFDQLPVAPGAGPFDFGRRSGGLFVSAVSLVKDAGCGGFESFMAEFTFEVGFTGTIAGEFMYVPKFSRGAEFLTDAARVMFQVRFLLGFRGYIT